MLRLISAAGVDELDFAADVSLAVQSGGFCGIAPHAAETIAQEHGQGTFSPTDLNHK